MHEISFLISINFFQKKKKIETAFGTEKNDDFFSCLIIKKKNIFFKSNTNKECFKKQTNDEMIYFFKFKGLKTH